MQPISVYFKNYDAPQIQEILLQRAKAGLHSWEASKLSEIAALSTKHSNSDARVAIKTLFYTVTDPSESLEVCFEKAREDIIVEMLNYMSDPVLMILQAITSSKSDFAKEIYKRYSMISSRHKEKPFSYVHYYANLSCLQSMGLVALISTKVGMTYANRVIMTFGDGILEPICRLRFG